MANSPQTYPRRIPYGMVAAYNWTHADARDTSWNGNDGTLNGDAAASSGVLTLDGTGDYVSASALSGGDHLTMSAWIKPSSITGNRNFINRYRASGNNRSFLFALRGDVANDPFQIAYSGNGINVDYLFFNTNGSAWWPGLNVWMHVVATINTDTPGAGSMKFYFNGVGQAYTGGDTFNGFGTIYGGTAPLEVGGYSEGSAYFEGDMGSTRIYNRALSATEIADIYRNERPLYIPSATATGLEAWYRYYGNANDVTGNGNDGTLNGDAAASGGVLTLDGNGDYVNVPDSDNFDLGAAGEASWSCWLKCDTSSSARRFLHKWNNDVSRKSYTFSVFSEQLYLVMSSDGTTNTVATGGIGSIPDQVWSLVTIVWDGVDVTPYINGASYASYPLASLYDVIDPFYIGVWKTQTTELYHWDGQIGSTRIYNRALTAQEISDIYNNERGDYP